MKKLKLLWMIRTISKSMAFSHNQSGYDLLESLYEELAGAEDVDEPENEKEEMGFHGQSKTSTKE